MFKHKIKFKNLIIVLGVSVAISLTCMPQRNTAAENEEILSVQDITFLRSSKKKIQISWNKMPSEHIKSFIVKKKSFVNDINSDAEWEEVKILDASEYDSGEKIKVIDELADKSYQRYLYRVDTEYDETLQNIQTEGKEIPASNILVCIDPGHYKGRNAVEGQNSYGYVEGDFVLKIAKLLKQDLKQNYGIDVYMTRTKGDIELGGYKNMLLDNGHISLRGEYASKRNSDLFVSLHTNANQANANGYETNSQPLKINKAMIIVNKVSYNSPEILEMCNEIGDRLTQVNYELGISKSNIFKRVENGTVKKWTSKYNDGLNKTGTVVYRWSNGNDYYGVLRGAANAGIPGIIIEHGMHTIPKLREIARDGKLAERWAEADAEGIASAFGVNTVYAKD